MKGCLQFQVQGPRSSVSTHTQVGPCLFSVAMLQEPVIPDDPHVCAQVFADMVQLLRAAPYLFACVRFCATEAGALDIMRLLVPWATRC